MLLFTEIRHFPLILISLFLMHVKADVDFYTFSVTDSDGNSVSLEKYRGKVTLVTNVASECGFTDKHYKGFVKTKDILNKDGKFEILAFPCNQFGAQEPNEINEILDFAKDTYNVNFPIFAKINVIENDVPKAWQFLEEKAGTKPSWNFWKYLVNHNGQLLGSWGPWSDLEEIYPALKSAVHSAVKEENARMPYIQGKVPVAPGSKTEAQPPAPASSGKSGPPTGAPRTGSGPPQSGPPEIKPPAVRSQAHTDL